MDLLIPDHQFSPMFPVLTLNLLLCSAGKNQSTSYQYNDYQVYGRLQGLSYLSVVALSCVGVEVFILGSSSSEDELSSSLAPTSRTANK